MTVPTKNREEHKLERKREVCWDLGRRGTGGELEGTGIAQGSNPYGRRWVDSPYDSQAKHGVINEPQEKGAEWLAQTHVNDEL